PNIPESEAERKDVEAAAQAIGPPLDVLEVGTEGDIESAFAMLMDRGVRALFVGTGPFFFSNRERVVALAARHSIPAIYSTRDAVLAGGLMSYGSRKPDAFRNAGAYTGRVLKGEKAAALPGIQSTTFAFVLNLKTAKALRLDIPDRVLALADEAIE